jgi:hypothetical protein
MNWFGIAVLVLFSLGLSLFFQFDPKRLQRRPVIDALGVWVAVGIDHDGQLIEQRKSIVPGGLLRRARLVEQDRHKDPISGEVTWVSEERVLLRWYEG